MRYIIFILLFLPVFASAQIRDYQIRNDNAVNVWRVLLTDTLASSGTYGLGSWQEVDSLQYYGVFNDTDWLRYRTGTTPTNSDTAYHTGIITIGDDSIYTGTLNLLGRLDMRFPVRTLSNIAFGNNSLSDLMTGDRNIGFGASTLSALSSGTDNIAVGNQSGVSVSTGQHNTFFGTRAGSRISTGSYNTMIGPNAGDNGFLLGTSNHNVWIGKNVGYSGVVAPDSTLIFDIQTLGTSSLLWGDFGSNLIHINGKLLYTTEGGTGTTIAGRDASEYFTNIGTGWGIDLTSGNLVVDSSQVATVYDLTTISAGNDHDWYEVGGTTPPNHIDDNMFSGTGNHGIGTTSPSKPLHVVGEARITGSGGTATTITGRDTDEDLTDVTTGWGIDLTSGVLIVDSTEVATQYDLTLVGGGGMTNWFLAASGTGGTEEVNSGETVTITGAGINVATRSGGNVTITGTEVDGSTTNEAWTIDADDAETEVISNQTVLFTGTGIATTDYDAAANTLTIDATEVDGDVTNEIQTLSFTGASAPFTLDLSLTVNDVAFDRSGIITLTETPANTLVIGATEIDGSTTNETNTIEEGNVSVQTGNLNIDFQTLFDVTADGATEVNVSLDLSESTTVTTPESDDYVIMHDAGSAQHQKILWDDLKEDIISFNEDNINEGTGYIIDIGTGIDLAYSSFEATYTLDFNEFTTDAATEGDEYVIIYDPSAGIQEKVLVTSVGGFDGNGIYTGSGTVPTAVTATLTDNITFNATASEADFFIDGTNDLIGIGTNSPENQLTISNEDSNLSYPIMAFHTDQTASGSAVLGLTNYYYGAEDLVRVQAQKQTSTGTNDAELTISMEDASNSTINAVQFDYEEGYTVDFPRTRVFGGMQMARVDSVGSNITLDESYYAVRCTTAAITITLVNGTTTNGEFIGTQFWIYNDSGGNVTIDPGGSTDFVNGSNSNITVADNEGWLFMLMHTTALGTNYWMGIKTP